LVLPKQPRILYDTLLREIPARRRVLTDKEIEGLALGQYPMEGMFAMDSRALGSPKHYASYEILGEHTSCHTNLELNGVSASHKAIVCKKCCLRVPIPRTVKTYGQLRAFMAEHVKPAK